MGDTQKEEKVNLKIQIREWVREFTYLRVKITENVDEIQARC